MCESGLYPRIARLDYATICDVGPCPNETRTRIHFANSTAVDICTSCRAKLKVVVAAVERAIFTANDSFGVEYEYRRTDDGKVQFRRKGRSAWEGTTDKLEMECFSADELVAVANAMNETDCR